MAIMITTHHKWFDLKSETNVWQLFADFSRIKGKCLEGIVKGIVNLLMDVVFLTDKQFIDETGKMFSSEIDSMISMKRLLPVEMYTVCAITVGVLLTSIFFPFQLVAHERKLHCISSLFFMFRATSTVNSYLIYLATDAENKACKTSDLLIISTHSSL